MYVRIVTYSMHPAVTMDQARAIFAELTEILRRQAGYQGLSLLVNEVDRQAITLSYWQDQESAVQAGQETLPILMDRTSQFVDRPPEISGFDLIAQDPEPVAAGHTA